MNVDGIKKLKEHRVAEGQGVEGDDDLTPMVEVFRGEDLVAMIVAPQVDRDQGLDAARMAAVGFSADKISMVLDAHVSSSPINPKTGEEWGPGEMQRACHEDGACQVGLITDTLIIIDHYRSGRHREEMLPYHVHADDKTVHWVGADSADLPRVIDTDNEGEGVDGIIPNAIFDAFKEPVLFDVMKQQLGLEAFHLTEEQARVHCDCAMAKILGQQGFQVALVPTSEEAVTIIQSSMEGLLDTD